MPTPASTWLDDLEARATARKARRVRREWPSDDYRNKPVEFCADVLAFTPWERQAEWMHALTPEGAAVSVASGHKVGKSTGGAGVGLWFWGTRRRARIVLMAPKVEHIEHVLWLTIALEIGVVARVTDAMRS
jgi:hypothetical protein